MEHFSSVTRGLSSLLRGPMGEHRRGEDGAPMWSWPWSGKKLDKVQFGKGVLEAAGPVEARLGQAVVDFGTRLDGVVQKMVQHLPLPRTFQRKDGLSEAQMKQPLAGSPPGHMDYVARASQRDAYEAEEEFEDNEDYNDEKMRSQSGKHQVSVLASATYNSRTQDIESSVVAMRDNWRAEVSLGAPLSESNTVPLFLFQQFPLFVVRDTTLLLNLHSSEQHSLWYGFDRKNGLHSLCPVLWSKDSEWCFLSMICPNSITCPFIDVQFPNGQFTYAAGEGLSAKAFVPAYGGFLQAQCHYPGETKLSFSCMNRWGTSITPAVQWPDKSFTFSMVQPLPWQWSRPVFQSTTQLSVTPTFGGRNGGLKTEVVHTMRDQFSFACGCAFTINPTAFASISVGGSKSNRNSGIPGIVLRVDSPLEDMGRANFSIRLNTGIEL